MKLTDVVRHSISRRKRRTFLVMMGIAFAVAILISVTGVTMTYAGIIKSSFQPYSGKVAVVHSSSRFFEAIPSQSILDPTLESEIAAVEDVVRVAPVSMRTYEGSDGLIPSILVGIRTSDRFFVYPQLLIYPKGHWPQQPGEVVIGSASPYYLEGAREGDQISLYGINLTVSGVLLPTEIRIFNTFLIVNLDFYYDLTRTQFVSLFLVQTETPELHDKVARNIEASIPYVTALTDDTRAILVGNIIDKVDRWNSYVGMLAALMSISLITTIQYLTTIQRQREFGTMKAIGAPNIVMIRLILTENLMIGVLGCVFGVILGFLGAYGIVILYNGGNVLNSLSQTFELLSWKTMLTAFISGLLVAVVSVILPLKRVLDLDPVLSISNPEV